MPEGTIFMATIAAETAAPSHASARSEADADAPGRRDRARNAAHAESQPTPTAREPTSVIGTRRASPRNTAAAVRKAIRRIAFPGVA